MKFLLALTCFSLLIPSFTALTVSFSRRLDTCDPQDQVLTDGTTKFVYAYSSQNPSNTGGRPTYHEQSGTRSARIMEGKPVQPVLPKDAHTLSFQVNNLAVPFPQDDPTTSYYCTIFAINITSRAHIIQWEPVFAPKQNVKFVHHILMYECDVAALDVGYSGLCFDPNFKYTACQNNNVLSAWAVGGAPFNYPSNIGYPIGTSDTVRYIMMETHYNNVDQVPVVDSSGMKYTITNELRPIEAGVFVTGFNTDPRFTIPAGIGDSPWLAPCPSTCTHEIFPQPVKILATLLHMHTAGKSMKTRQIRNGTELPVIMADSYYDFNFQDFEYLATPRDVFPGDEFITECHYDTTSRQNITHFGLSTRQEMCLAFHIYHPRITSNVATCSFGNYSQFHYPTDPPAVRAPTASCGTNTVILNVTLPNITTPLPINNCTHSIPDTTPPRIADISQLNISSYDRQLYLDGDDSAKVSLWWSVDHITQLIHFAMNIDVEGWIGLGFSPTGGMINSDVITLWSYNNTLHVEDRFALQHALPPMDTYQDIINVVFYSGSLPDSSSSSTGSFPGSSTGTSHDDSSSGLSKPIIIAIIASGGGLVLVLLVLAYCYRVRKHNDKYHTLLAGERVNYAR